MENVQDDSGHMRALGAIDRNQLMESYCIVDGQKVTESQDTWEFDLQLAARKGFIDSWNVLQRDKDETPRW